MHKGDEIPLLSQNAGFDDIILEMTSKRLGCVGFVDEKGHFCGMLTDGDLRRCIKQDLKNSIASSIMTKEPVTVSGDMFASEALKIMNRKKMR